MTNDAGIQVRMAALIDDGSGILDPGQVVLSRDGSRLYGRYDERVRIKGLQWLKGWGKFDGMAVVLDYNGHRVFVRPEDLETLLDPTALQV